MNHAYLDIVTPRGTQRLTLSDQPVTIGRSSRNVVTLEEDGVSREHCVVERDGQGYRLRDLGSRNGTWVEGQRVEKVPLRPGDAFQVGESRFTFGAAAPAAAAPPAARPTAQRREQEARPAATGEAAPAGNAAKAVARALLRRRRQAAAPPPPTADAEEPAGAAFPPPVSLDAYASADPTPAQRGSGPDLDADDPVGTLRRLVETGPHKEFAEQEIALISARGQVIHPAQAAGDESDVDEAAESILLLRLILLAAFRTRASDLHFEVRAQDALVRLRVDGTMVPAVRMQHAVAQRITSSVKVLADIDIAQRNIVQEGHFSSQVPGRHVDYRVSFTPAMHGQKLVIRVLDAHSAPQHMEDLNLPAWMFQQIRKVSRQTSGMVLVCGPTGSGKTTTLYSVLRDVDTNERNVITIEDPVEYQLEGVTQIPADEARGNDFHQLLRSVLRQDPDVILLGEIRDTETAKTAMQAAMTGHLVLSTVHAKDTIGTIFRLLDLGLESYLVGSSLNLVLAQRLIRLLCENCKAPKKPMPRETMKMGRRGREVQRIYYPVGCPRCLGVGYHGRRGLFELLVVNDSIRDAILNNPTMAAIREALKRTVFTSLEEAAWECVAGGITSVEEVERIIGDAGS